MKKLLFVAVVMVVVVAALASGAVRGTAADKRVTVTGTLQYDAPDWFLATAEGAYLLHFGNRYYFDSLGLALKEGEQLTVEGVRFQEDFLVYSVMAEGKTYSFRDRDGIPLWAGRGNRWSRNQG